MSIDEGGRRRKSSDNPLPREALDQAFEIEMIVGIFGHGEGNRFDLTEKEKSESRIRFRPHRSQTDRPRPSIHRQASVSHPYKSDPTCKRLPAPSPRQKTFLKRPPLVDTIKNTRTKGIARSRRTLDHPLGKARNHARPFHRIRTGRKDQLRGNVSRPIHGLPNRTISSSPPQFLHPESFPSSRTLTPVTLLASTSFRMQ